MPRCSTCGYAVEWVRRCRTSYWRLRRDNLEALTRGRYVRCPTNAPDYPGFHFLGTRDWVSDDGPRSLGEWDGAYQWYNGQAPTPFPAPIVLGNMSDIAGGTCQGGPVVGNPPCSDLVDQVLTLRVRCSEMSAGHEALEGAEFDIHQPLEHIAIWSGHTGIVGQDYNVVLGCGPAGQWALDFVGLFHRFPQDSSWVRPFRLEYRDPTGTYVIWDPTGPPPPPPVPLRDGFPLACYTPTPIRPAVEIQDPAVQLGLAQVLALTYTDIDAAAAAMQVLAGPDAVVTAVPNSTSIVPGTVIAKRADLSIIAISGTTTPEQLALQILYASSGLSDMGTYSTNLVWFAATGEMHDRLGRAGIDPATPVVIAGHSYGGAVAALVAGDYLRFTPERNVQLLTFGAPKPGDARLRTVLLAGRRIHYVNGGDPTPALPPSDFWIGPIFALVPAILLADWVAWRQLDNHLLLEVDGSIEPIGPLPLPLPELLLAAAAAVGVTPFPAFADHAMSEYLARLSRAMG